MIKEFDAVLFDLDGTLIDSMWLWHAIDLEYLKRFNLTPPKDLSAAIEGMSYNETAVYFKERFNISDSIEKIKADASVAPYFEGKTIIKEIFVPDKLCSFVVK